MQITDLIMAIGCAVSYRKNDMLSKCVYVTACLYIAVRVYQIWR